MTTGINYRSTEHFWYCLQPPGPYIDSHRGSRAFGFSDETIYLSEDNGRTWPHSIAFPDARRITFSCIWKCGNILFGTDTKLYVSTDRLRSVQPVLVTDATGADYIAHAPHNPKNPGWYFLSLAGVTTHDVGGREMLVWGNYGNVRGGATPENIYYSVDGGRTVKIAYAFGQNPYYRNNGWDTGGREGMLLGDPANRVICRHIHCVAYNPAENAFYACTGDMERPTRFECHWLRGTYDAQNDLWHWNVVVSGNRNTRYKSGGINFVDGKLYWISDANGTPPHDRGIFCCRPADIANPHRHTRLFNPRFACANMIIEDGVILAGHYALDSPFSTGIIYSPDMGRTWAQYDLKEFGKRSPMRFQHKNSDGWFRVDLRAQWIDHDQVLFIKPKPHKTVTR